MDRLETRTDPMLQTEGYQYDPNGNLELFTDRKGQKTKYGYDPLNRRTKATYADGTDTAYIYDLGDRLIHVVDSLTGTTTLAYDSLDRLIQELTPSGVVDYQYDALGRRTTLTADGQTPVVYTYGHFYKSVLGVG